MAAKSLDDLSEEKHEISFCHLSTRECDGGASTRPMSNNGAVGYDGDSRFFLFDDTRNVAAMGDDPNVCLSAPLAPLGTRNIFIAIEGPASTIKDNAAFEEHSVEDLGRWFEHQVGTSSEVVIKAHVAPIEYWDGRYNDFISVL